MQSFQLKNRMFRSEKTSAGSTRLSWLHETLLTGKLRSVEIEIFDMSKQIRSSEN